MSPFNHFTSIGNIFYVPGYRIFFQLLLRRTLQLPVLCSAGPRPEITLPGWIYTLVFLVANNLAATHPASNKNIPDPKYTWGSFKI
ncbi:MAG: hypothetical protein JWN76_923 [Chitinophagaceae bacterium]|nr:hypothetical protein [Chitinophagaceae bacterium]